MNLTEQERQKYNAMWQGPQYRRRSPAMRHVNDLLHYAAREKGDTLIDLGCGTGQAGKYLSRFFDVTLFDLCPEAVEFSDLPFIEGNIWDLNLPVFDWIFCSDVMEHMPPEHVEATLDGMARITRKGGLIAVCHLESDSSEFGVDVGRLHLSVHPQEWWQEKIEKRWELKTYDTNWKETSFIVGSPARSAR